MKTSDTSAFVPHTPAPVEQPNVNADLEAELPSCYMRCFDEIKSLQTRQDAIANRISRLRKHAHEIQQGTTAPNTIPRAVIETDIDRRRGL